VPFDPAGVGRAFPWTVCLSNLAAADVCGISADGTKGCSVVVGLDTVTRNFAPVAGRPAVRQTEAAFWAHEFTPGLPAPSRVEDLVIHELHIDALGFGRATPGALADAMALLPQLADLGVKAIELPPMSEFSGIGWGHDSHLFVIESTAGIRDQYRHFVREFHRRGIAVMQDVVYNHFDPSADRAQWAHDSDAPSTTSGTGTRAIRMASRWAMPTNSVPSCCVRGAHAEGGQAQRVAGRRGPHG